MKYLIVIGSGLTDQPIAERDNKTPLQLAETPNLDRWARISRTGSVRTIPQNLHTGNDVSLLALLGYDPGVYHSGSAAFSAAALGVNVGAGEVPLCCDFVQLQSSHNDMVMKDFTAGNLSSEKSRVLLAALQEQIADSPVRFYPGAGHHNLMVIESAPFDGRLNPPMELIGEGIRQFMPDGGEFKELVYIMNQAQIILHNHPYNRSRQREGKDTVNSVWLWGNGQQRTLPPFAEIFGKQGVIVTSSLIFQGMGKSAAMDIRDIKESNGGANHGNAGKVNAALGELENRDVVYLHVDDIEEISLKGNLDDKVLALEDFDHEVAGPLLDAVEKRNDVKMLLVVNHAASANLMKYTKDDVPFLVYPAVSGAGTARQFDEALLKDNPNHFQTGQDLIAAFLKDRL